MNQQGIPAPPGEDQDRLPRMDRRSVLLSAAALPAGLIAAFHEAHGLVRAEGQDPPMMGGGRAAAPLPGGYLMDHELSNSVVYPHVHEGKGSIDVKFFFRGEAAAEPALFLIYTIPPGASEGVHVHMPGDKKLGSYDEFYYIVSGSGEMEIDGRKVPVKPGDHVLTPNGVPHGIENTATAGDLKVYLLAMMRD